MSLASLTLIVRIIDGFLVTTVGAERYEYYVFGYLVGSDELCGQLIHRL